MGGAVGVDSNIKNSNENEERTSGDKYVIRGVIIILLSPVLGFLSTFVYYLLVSSVIPGTANEEALIIISGISMVALGMTSVIVGCTKNLTKHN